MTMVMRTNILGATRFIFLSFGDLGSAIGVWDMAVF